MSLVSSEFRVQSSEFGKQLSVYSIQQSVFSVVMLNLIQHRIRIPRNLPSFAYTYSAFVDFLCSLKSYIFRLESSVLNLPS